MMHLTHLVAQHAASGVAEFGAEVVGGHLVQRCVWADWAYGATYEAEGAMGER